MKSSQFKQNPHQLLRISPPFAHYRWSWYIKESCFAFCGNSFCQHSLNNKTIMVTKRFPLIKNPLKYTLPVPGGPNNNTPFQGSNNPVKNWGYFKGNSTASFNNPFAVSSPTISVNLTLGFSMQMSLCRYWAKSLKSGISNNSWGMALRTRFS